MSDAPAKTVKHPRKRFAVPPDIAALGNYAVPIIDDMRREHASRIAGKRK